MGFISNTEYRTMSFTQATAAAPADADFISYRGGHVWNVVQRRSDGIWSTCANVTPEGYSLIVSGIHAQGASLWSYESRQFITGTFEQLSREEEA